MSHANPNPNRNTPAPLPDFSDGSADVVAGDPVVPITVWRTPRGGDEDSAIPARLTQRLVAAYTRRGETVIDLTDGHAVSDAALAGGRRCHQAWFTTPTEVIIGPHTSPATGADATRPARGREQLPSAGSVSLIAASWPLDADTAGSRTRLAVLLAACGHMLRPGGCVVLVAANPPATSPAPEDFTEVVAAAKHAGLGYLQHIVAARADVDGDQFVYHATDDELAALTAGTDGGRLTPVHMPVHADLFVFTFGGADA